MVRTKGVGNTILVFGNAQRPSIQNVRVDHGGAHVAAAKKFLAGADVLPRLQQEGGKGMPKRM